MRLSDKNNQSDTSVVMQFLSQGGAAVEIRQHRFTTSYSYVRSWGRSYDYEKTRTVDGYQWVCQGCDTVGQAAYDDGSYLPEEIDRARTDANRHATACRAMPKPQPK